MEVRVGGSEMRVVYAMLCEGQRGVSEKGSNGLR